MKMNKQDILAANDSFSVLHGVEMPSTAESISRRWMQERARKPESTLDANQLTSLSAMIAYIAYQSGQSEFRIERNLADHFHIPNAKLLAANDFDDAIRYLADILPT